MTTVYLSGPMTSIPNYNRAAFVDAARRWNEKGHAVLNPADSFGGRTDLSRETYMRLDIALLLQADAMVQLAGWERSRGAHVEHTVAKAIGLDIWRDEA